jgi:hypothetical protein
MAWKKQYKKVRKPEGRWAEDTHTTIAVFCAIGLIFGAIAIIAIVFPPEKSSASGAAPAVRILK